jgi:uncharacterized damage-inducible protein DinB
LLEICIIRENEKLHYQKYLFITITMINFCQQNLQQINDVMQNIDDDIYTKKSSLLSNGTIGQHIRHVIEFYTCLLDQCEDRMVNYDTRKRDLYLENDKFFAQKTINTIIDSLQQSESNYELTLLCNFAQIEDESFSLPTSLHRELAFCLEHSIHHQALIKIALLEFKLEHVIPEKFGMAPSTIRAHLNVARSS